MKRNESVLFCRRPSAKLRQLAELSIRCRIDCVLEPFRRHRGVTHVSVTIYQWDGYPEHAPRLLQLVSRETPTGDPHYLWMRAYIAPGSHLRFRINPSLAARRVGGA
jgi:phosphodiesterase/alkaline phosphatase D-like protein